GQGSARREARRAAGRAADQVRSRHQSHHREGTGNHDSGIVSAARRRGDRVRRREVIALLGGATAAASLWPRAARAQQPAMPVVGLLLAGSPRTLQVPLAGLHRGLAESGYVEGQSVAIEYRFAEGRFERLPALAADLVRRQVAALVVSSP